jgi:hypothetical protein
MAGDTIATNPAEREGTPESGRTFSQDELERVVGERLARARSRYDRELAELKERLAGFDPEESARLKREAESLARDTAAARDEAARLKAEMEAERAAAAERLTAEKTALKTRLRRYELDDRVRQAALAAGVLPADLEDVIVLTARHFRLEDDGELSVLDEAGQPTGASVAEFFARTYRERRPKFYGASLPGGSGALPATGTRPDPLGERYAGALKSGDVAAAIALKNRMFRNP